MFARYRLTQVNDFFQIEEGLTMNFASDNVYGVDESIMAALIKANHGTAAAYCGDEITRRVEQRFNEVFEREVQVFLLTTGTAANALALSTMAPPFGAIFCHAFAHIAADECGAPELFTGGAKLIGLDGVGGKISPQMVRASLKGFIRGEHDPRPAAISITQSSELGTLYSLDEISEFGDLAGERNLKFHMDGARFANALVALGCSPAQMTWKRGVDALSFGATKNGAMSVEGLVFFDAELAVDFEHRRMRAGQLLSKNRYMAAQMEAYLENDLWLNNARHANAMASRLAKGLAKAPGIRLGVPCQANEVFAILPKIRHDVLAASDAVFHQWLASGSDTEPVGEDEIMIRLVTSFQTLPEDVDRFIALAGQGR
jgi:threonine aldolase